VTTNPYTFTINMSVFETAAILVFTLIALSPLSCKRVNVLKQLKKAEKSLPNNNTGSSKTIKLTTANPQLAELRLESKVETLKTEIDEQNSTYLRVIKMLEEENEALKTNLTLQSQSMKQLKEKCDLLEIKWNVLKEFRGNV